MLKETAKSLRLYFGFIFANFADLLPHRPRIIKRILTIHLLLGALGFAASLAGSFNPGSMMGMLLAVLVYVYLMKTINRFSTDIRLQAAKG